MKSSEIRSAFLGYFGQRGHEVVKSSSLIPRDDPTLLFTNAGMVPFKNVFLGDEKRPYARAASCQKCMRAGGKHSDLENVGRTNRHHTFFEMLGNFSFGDYFKRDAIRFGWELLVDVYGIAGDKLWVSVFEEDDEAAGIWLQESGVPEDRIVRLGHKDNFWQMGDTGPCGPCSEILIDQGADMGCDSEDCAPGCDCDRYLELWNLVFMQYHRDSAGTLNPLPRPSIDTGMGLERITAVLEGVTSNFDTDLFTGIISAIEGVSGATYGGDGRTDISIRVIADHVRAAAFLISDGLLPANEGRGYVLRRVIRRASRHARLLGVENPALYGIVDSVAETMGAVYPELVDEKVRARKILRFEEERFQRTLQKGTEIMDSLVASVKGTGGSVIPGEEVFKLYDTFGFPLDLARDIAEDEGLGIDEAGYRTAMDAQKQRARASWVGQDRAVEAVYRELLTEHGETEALSHDSIEDTPAVLRAAVKDGRVVEALAEGDEGELVLDRSPFYGESGGQVGDTGLIGAEGVRVQVTDTKRPLEGLPVHVVKVLKGEIRTGAEVLCTVDAERRRAIMRNHTATHLLQAALRAVLGEHVKQSGSLVAPDRLRFDFTHFSALSAGELRAVEDIVNENILDNVSVDTEEMGMEQAIQSGAVALFGEKYGDRVRVVSVPGFSAELCGGTHTPATGDIGLFEIVSEGSVAAGVRRIEALTGTGAFGHLRARREELQSISTLLKASGSPLERVRGVLDEMKSLRKELDAKKSSAASDVALQLVGEARTVGGIKVVSRVLDGYGRDELRLLGDSVRDRLGSGVVVLCSKVNGSQAFFLAMVTKDLLKTCHAGDILKEVAAATGGRGGGKPDMAQGGTKELGNLDNALEKVYDLIKGKA